MCVRDALEGSSEHLPTYVLHWEAGVGPRIVLNQIVKRLVEQPSVSVEVQVGASGERIGAIARDRVGKVIHHLREHFISDARNANLITDFFKRPLRFVVQIVSENPRLWDVFG
ncbi:hypothetical protein [Haloplanus halophilus]|uniref:hypothetical protein n=1 Tax=Haloplanus halophilus TaxID=2949993 RepID=UPI00203F14D9|nr:hypothetical protein [Haloplanus sp. GDY1]